MGSLCCNNRYLAIQVPSFDLNIAHNCGLVLNCFAGTDQGDVYTWGWKECVPTGRVIGDQVSVGTMEKDERQMAMATDQGGNAYFLHRLLPA